MQVRESVSELLVERFTNDEEWVDYAACLDTEYDPIDRNDAAVVVSEACPSCPVRKRCLQTLVDTDRPGNAGVGAFGGVNRWKSSSEDARAALYEMKDTSNGV